MEPFQSLCQPVFLFSSLNPRNETWKKNTHGETAAYTSPRDWDRRGGAWALRGGEGGRWSVTEVYNYSFSHLYVFILCICFSLKDTLFFNAHTLSYVTQCKMNLSNKKVLTENVWSLYKPYYILTWFQKVFCIIFHLKTNPGKPKLLSW